MKPLLFAFVILAAVGQEALAQSLNAMTWNIRYNNPDDGVNAWPNRKDWVAEIVIKNKVDIAGFQEVLVGQLEDLKVRLPEMDVYGVGRDDGKTQVSLLRFSFARIALSWLRNRHSGFPPHLTRPPARDGMPPCLELPVGSSSRTARQEPVSM